MVREAARRRATRGAALVEFAIVAPLVFLVFFSVVELAFTFRSASITSSAARAGARVAAAAYGGTTTDAERLAVLDSAARAVEASLDDLRSGTDPDRLYVYEADAGGDPTAGTLTTCTSSCVEYRWNGSARRFEYHGGAWTDPDDCGATLDRVGVHVTVRHKAFSKSFGIGIDVSERTIMRLEPGEFSTCTAE